MATYDEYMPVWLSFFDDPKLKKLQRAIKNPLADTLVLRLWRYAWNYYHDGMIPGGAEEIEDACGWISMGGEPGALTQALVDCNFIEQEGNNLHIHSWDTYAGRLRSALNHTRERNRERNRERRVPGKETSQSKDGTPGLLQSLTFFRSPGMAAKRRSMEDLIRIGIGRESIMAKAATMEARQMDFYEFVNWCRGKNSSKESAIDRIIK